jgi:hypothetical protein
VGHALTTRPVQTHDDRVRLEADALAIASGQLAIVERADVLTLAEVNLRRPIPVAAHRTANYCVVFFIIKQTDSYWRTEVVPVREGAVDWYGGSTGLLPSRSDVEPGKPLLDHEGRLSLDDGRELLQIAGTSADESVRLRWQGNVVAEATVAAHGYFVLSAILPIDADASVEAV